MRPILQPELDRGSRRKLRNLRGEPLKGTVIVASSTAPPGRWAQTAAMAIAPTESLAGLTEQQKEDLALQALRSLREQHEERERAALAIAETGRGEDVVFVGENLGGKRGMAASAGTVAKARTLVPALGATPAKPPDGAGTGLFTPSPNAAPVTPQGTPPGDREDRLAALIRESTQQIQSTMRVELSGVRREIAHVREDVTELREEHGQVRQDLDSLKKRVSELEAGPPVPQDRDVPRHLRTTMVVGKFPESARRNDMLNVVRPLVTGRTGFTEIWAPRRRGGVVKVKWDTPHNMRAFLDSRPAAAFNGTPLWMAIERTEAEARQRRPIAEAASLLKLHLPPPAAGLDFDIEWADAKIWIGDKVVATKNKNTDKVEFDLPALQSLGYDPGPFQADA